ncbi:16953_t:CDS:2, partial [Funneliformis geosporum]
RVIESREREVKKDVIKALSVLDAPTTPSPGNASTAPPPHYTPITPPHNASTMPPPLSQNILKRSLDIYETGFEMDWAPWKFDITIISNVNIECVLMSLHEK